MLWSKRARQARKTKRHIESAKSLAASPTAHRSEAPTDDYQSSLVVKLQQVTSLTTKPAAEEETRGGDAELMRTVTQELQTAHRLAPAASERQQNNLRPLQSDFENAKLFHLFIQKTLQPI